jgi:8-oxo-dGTP pyrophosphatase MutT (NUDIX family)
MTSIRDKIQSTVNSLSPFDELEQEHISFTKNWIESGVEIFRTAKPATPDPHLVAYALLIDPLTNQILLVDHKKAGLWLPAGGHVEINELPMETVKREILEELAIKANFMIEDPVFLTVTKTVGQIVRHTDVSFWYLLKGSNEIPLQYDQEEFNDVRWFDINYIPYENTDPHMRRFIQKLLSIKHKFS